MTTDSDCDNSQYNKDEDLDRDNYQSDKDDNSQSDEDEERAVCDIIYPDDGGFWIGCDGCNDWFDFKCTNIKSKKSMFQMSITVKNVECEQFLTILSSVS